jgi:hypothetical protein
MSADRLGPGWQSHDKLKHIGHFPNNENESLLRRWDQEFSVMSLPELQLLPQFIATEKQKRA